ncbi:cytidylyltransferase domain-containing protein [Halorubrum lipolyticum]|uniref:Cytidyltransferase-like protein n=1 Tax=Halorubrum lipolyticum DSM 21995 TaxID=1227482 RepID=M0NZU6_9EURY|nr:glycosyltransferase [Halorubrum lipolyticum]EMA63068.1 cytidyltransferase-like protein [Halorubrum lipolyticum DSM 21995]
MAENVVSVIPARKGSKGIPRKNIRELNGKPLIAHAIEASKNTSEIDHTVLTTDSDEIAQIGREYGADEIIHRPKELATDEVPLAPVIQHAYAESEGNFEYVLCFQPTVPLITHTSVEEGIQQGLQTDSDSVIYIRDSTHQYWKKTNGEYNSVSADRKNRQMMEPIYEEIGVFLSHRSIVEDGRRICDSPSFYEVDRREGIDIDTYEDWKIAESVLQRKQLVYRLIGNGNTGTGHVYRGITLADHIFEHDVLFAVEKKDELAIDKLAESNYAYRVFEGEQAILEYIRTDVPDVVVNDVLDTSVEYMQSLAELDSRIVNFEDLGVGSKYADAIINALYEHSTPPENHYFGSEYFCLRSEFRYATPLEEIPSVERIMISFGGTDENDLTAKALRALSALNEEYEIDVVLGLGYTERDHLDTIIEKFSSPGRISVSQNINSMAKHMEQADLLITSNGRTLYEAASLNLPMISIAQNAREQKHPFAHISRGVLSLGHANYVSEENLQAAVEDYCSNREQREMMRNELSTHDIANGIERIKKIMFEEANEN